LVVSPIFWRDRSVRTAVFLSLVMPVAVGLAIVLAGSTWTETMRTTLVQTSGFGPLPKLLMDSWASMWSRAMLVVVGAQSLIDEPWRVLAGIGWGHYNEALLENLPIIGGRLHEYIGPSQVYWDAIRRADFHSHNQYFEALLSSGIGAAGLWMMYGAAIAATAPPERRRLALFVTLLLVTLQSFWFQMPHTLPVMAIAMVVLVGDAERSDTSRWLSNLKLLPGAGVVWGCVLVAAGLVAGLGSRNIAAERAEIDRIVSTEAGQSIERRFAAGLREIYDATLIQHVYARTHEENSERGLDILRFYLNAATDGDGPKTLKFRISAANVLSGIVFTRSRFKDRFGVPEREFRTVMEALVRRAPRRSDIAIPYFNHLLAAGREGEVLDFANIILARRGDDPVGLWFAGIVLLGAETTSDAGMKNLRRSLILGIRNLMPVDETLVHAIEH